MSQSIRNVLKSYAYNKVSDLVQKEKYVTPRILDEWERELHSQFKENDEKIGRARVRELTVDYILSEFGVIAFGVKPTIDYDPTVSEKTIKKMKSQRKKNFVDLKLVKDGSK